MSNNFWSAVDKYMDYGYSEEDAKILAANETGEDEEQED